MTFVLTFAIMVKMKTLTLNFDGSISKPNPGGLAAFGWYLSEDGQEISTGSGPIGIGPLMSNNYAEFYALYRGLQKINEIIESNSSEKHQIIVRGDSDLVIHIMNKQWRPNSEKLYYPAYELAFQELRKIRDRKIAVNFDWIPREKNTHADELSRWQQYK